MDPNTFNQIQISNYPYKFSGNSIQNLVNSKKRDRYPANHKSLKKRIFIKIAQYQNNRTAVIDDIVFDDNLGFREKMTLINLKKKRLENRYLRRISEYNTRLSEIEPGSDEYSTIVSLKTKIFEKLKNHTMSINLGTDLTLYDNTSNAASSDCSSDENSDIDILDYLNQLDAFASDHDPSSEVLTSLIYQHIRED